MKKSDSAYLIGATFVSVFSLTYCAIIRFHIRVPRYYPLEHTWRMIKQPGVPSQGWYGIVGLALITATLVTALVYVAIRYTGSGEKQLTPMITKLVGIGVTFIMIICAAYVMIYEFLRWGVF